MFFHGTRTAFTPKGLLLPRSQHGGPGTTAPMNHGAEPPADAATWVYLTDDLDLAWVYAFHAPGTNAPRVLVVEPMEVPVGDVEHSGAMGAFRCRAAVVSSVLREPTITEEQARAGWVTPLSPRA